MTEPSDNTVNIVVDTDEPQQVRMLTLNHPDVDNWMEEDLEAADIVVNGVGFERKRPDDYASSLVDGRLTEQGEKLGKVYERAALLIEGTMMDLEQITHSDVNTDSLKGRAASLHMRNGIPVIPTGGPPGTETGHKRLIDYAIRLGRKATEPPTSAYLEASDVRDKAPPVKRMYGCLSGVGPERADTLHEAYPDPADLVEADIAEVSRLPGIGEKTAAKLLSDFRGQGGDD